MLPVLARVVCAWCVSAVLLCPSYVFAQYGRSNNDVSTTGSIVVGCFILVLLIAVGISLWKEHKQSRLVKAEYARRTKPAKTAQSTPRYPHPSYRLSAWAWAMFWLLVALPFVFMAGRIAWHFFAFSWDGIPEGLADAKRILTAWRPMGIDALAVMPLFGFVGFKLHGRYSLPKPERPRIRPMYATAKICFFILSLVTMYYSLTRISHHVDNIVETGLLKEPEETYEGEAQLRTTILAAVTSAASKRDFDKEISDALDREDIAHAGIYIDLADWLKISVSPHIRARYQQTQRFWAKAIRSVEDCVSGAVLRNTENLTQIVCIVGSELFVSPIADGIDIVKQVIIHPLTGQETDFFIAGGAALSRFFDRRARLFKHADTAIRLQRVASKGGPTAAIIAARHASTVGDLRFAGRIANRFEGNTAGVLHLLGKRTFSMFKHYRIAKIVQLIMGGWAGLWALAMTALLSCLFSSVRSRVFRIFFLRWLKRVDDRRIAQPAGV